MAAIDPALRRKLLTAQRDEITECQVYRQLARIERNPENRRILERIAEDELEHNQTFARLTGRKLRPNHWQVSFIVLVARLFGLTFGVKLMEKAEERAQASYRELEAAFPDIQDIRKEEEEHEDRLLSMLDDERLTYVGSVVLGLNDALVELTGVLAGLTFALQNTRLIALSGLVTGIAAAMSMAASEYLSTRAEGGANPLKSSFYTGIAYIVTVFLMTLPYLLIENYVVCLALALGAAILIILVFAFYLAVAKDLSFWVRFGEMVSISLGVAALSFGIGVVVKHLLGVDV